MRDRVRRGKFLKFVGKRIRSFRENEDLTQMQLSFMSDLDRSFIQKVEHGQQSISFENIWEIARCLKRQISEFAPPIDEEL
ncbi:MAG: helix-turn-helix transcriptional regulator [Thermodesulfovibrionia bacterium]|nr:helix-turn-helix transcriptional regulator [Thermodesulfovibrionia bacterium]